MNNIRVLSSSILIALASVSSFISSGCSSTYRISDFSSKENFYSDFNNFARGKNLKVTLKSDSTIICNNGAEIKNDTLFFPLSESNITDDFMPLNKVKEINYKNHWLGIPSMLITGTLLGFAAGYILNSSIGVNNLNDNQAFYIGWGSTVIGTLIGSVAGYLIGYNYIYEFNP